MGSEVSTADQLRELTEKNTAECGAAIEALLVQHNCQMVGVPTMVPDGQGGWRIVVRVNLVPKAI